MQPVRQMDLTAQYRAIGPELDEAAKRVLASGHYVGGPEVTGFESAMADFCGVKHAVGCGSGTSALLMALMGLGIGPGDEVITTPFTFHATASTIRRVGATPVFVDIDACSYQINAARIEKAVTPRTKAILPVHLYGQAADMDAITAIAEAHNLKIIEDACQSLGAEYKGRPIGSLGHAACLSFFPSKNLGAAGDAGMILTDDDDLALRLRQMGNHGSDRRYHHLSMGLSSRLDTLQAALLAVKLKHLPEWNRSRQRIAGRYDQLLAPIKASLPCRSLESTHVFHQYVLRLPHRDALQKTLEAVGIETAVHYPLPLHLQPAFKDLKLKAGAFPVAEAAARQVLSLPMYPELDDHSIGRIADAVLAGSR